jgi:hypothetical protein
MRAIPADAPRTAAQGAAKPDGFWQRLAQALDAYFVDRTKWAVPDATFRRSRHEIDRCRRLMLKGALTPAHARVGYVSPHRTTRTILPLR